MPVTINDIKERTKELKNNKAPGLFGIHKNILLNLPDVTIGKIVKLTYSIT